MPHNEKTFNKMGTARCKVSQTTSKVPLVLIMSVLLQKDRKTSSQSGDNFYGKVSLLLCQSAMRTKNCNNSTSGMQPF